MYFSFQSGALTRSVWLRNSAISCNSFNVSGNTNLTFDAGTSTITTKNFYLPQTGLTLYNLVVNANTSSTFDSAMSIANNLTLNGDPTQQTTFLVTVSLTVVGTLTIAGTATKRVKLCNKYNTGSSVNVSSGAVVASYANFNDINALGLANWNLAGITGGSGDCGGNTGITFTAPTSQHWISASGGNTSDVTKWTSRVPLPQDDIYFDCAFGTAQTINFDITDIGRNIDFTGATWTTSLTTSLTGGSIFGSLTLIAGLTWGVDGNYFLFRGRGNHTININGATFDRSINICEGGTYSLSGNSVLSTGRTIYVNYGRLHTYNGTTQYNLTAYQINANSGATQGYVDFGQGTHTLTATQGLSPSGVGNIIADQATLKFTYQGTGTLTFNGAGRTYKKVWFTRGALVGTTIITGSNTFETLKFDTTVGNVLAFYRLTTQTMKFFDVKGTAGNLVTLTSDNTQNWYLVYSGLDMIRGCDYLNIQYCIATPASPTDTWYAGTHSVNNQAVAPAGSGWVFTDAPPLVPARTAKKKSYLYKIYSNTGTFITSWADVVSLPNFSTIINGSLSEMQVTLARGVTAFGEGVDIRYGNIVKLYCVDGDALDGVLIYTGFIASYEPVIDGAKETIEVSLAGFWWELNRYLFEGNGSGIDSLIYGNGYGANACAQMTADNAPSPNIVSASSSFTGWAPWRVFNRTINNTTVDGWFTASGNTTGWIQYNFGAGNAKVIGGYSIIGIQADRTGVDNDMEVAKDWTLQGSNDGATWTILDTQTNQNGWKVGAKNYYYFENQTAYQYWRLNITANNGSAVIVGVAEIELLPSLPFSRTGTTTIKYLSQDPSNILKDMLDKYVAQGGTPTYGAGTVDLTATVVSYIFNTNTVQEALQKIIELCPQDWYFYLGADNKIYLKPKSANTTHKFHIGRNVSYYRQEKRLENIVNYIYFKGANFYKKYSNSGSVTAYGRYSQKIVDERVTDTATADIMASTILNKMNSPEIRITIRVTDNALADGTGYDIESIKVGDTCKIFNATSKGENLWDTIQWDIDSWDYEITNTAGTVLQIQKITYNSDFVELEISNRQPDISKRIEDINRNLVDTQTANNPVIPQ
jgi:hypothetical protein